MKTVKNLKREADARGFAKISEGVYLATQEHMMAEQKEWPDEDSSKNIDFTTTTYWIWPEGDADCEEVAEDKDIEKYLV